MQGKIRYPPLLFRKPTESAILLIFTDLCHPFRDHILQRMLVFQELLRPLFLPKDPPQKKHFLIISFRLIIIHPDHRDPGGHQLIFQFRSPVGMYQNRIRLQADDRFDIQLSGIPHIRQFLIIQQIRIILHRRIACGDHLILCLKDLNRLRCLPVQHNDPFQRFLQLKLRSAGIRKLRYSS